MHRKADKSHTDAHVHMYMVEHIHISENKHTHLCTHTW